MKFQVHFIDLIFEKTMLVQDLFLENEPEGIFNSQGKRNKIKTKMQRVN